MKFTDNKVGEFLVVSVVGRLDVVTAPMFDDMLQDHLESGEVKIVIDMAEMDYISSAGLRSVLMAGKKMKEIEGGSISFCSLQGMVAEIFAVSGFETMVTLYDSVESATA